MSPSQDFSFPLQKWISVSLPLHFDSFLEFTGLLVLPIRSYKLSTFSIRVLNMYVIVILNYLNALFDNSNIYVIYKFVSDDCFFSSVFVFAFGMPCNFFLTARHVIFGNSYWNESEKAMAPHSSTLAWKIPWTEDPGRPQSMGSLRVGHDWATSLSLFTFTFHFHALEKEMQPTPMFLPGESQGQGSLVGCCLQAVPIWFIRKP